MAVGSIIGVCVDFSPSISTISGSLIGFAIGLGLRLNWDTHWIICAYKKNRQYRYSDTTCFSLVITALYYTLSIADRSTDSPPLDTDFNPNFTFNASRICRCVRSVKPTIASAVIWSSPSYNLTSRLPIYSFPSWVIFATIIFFAIIISTPFRQLDYI